jgi:hypothetical protein
MARLLRVTTVIGVLILGTASTSQAQGTTATGALTNGFTVGYTDIGPVIGLGEIGEAGVSIGARFERAFKRLPQWGDGVLSFSVSVDHYRYDQGDFDFSYTPIGATVNYHVRLTQRQWDPFVGIGLGHYLDSTPDICVGCDFNSGLYFIGRAGLRYFWRPNLALYADIGSGPGVVRVGVMVKLRDGE